MSTIKCLGSTTVYLLLCGLFFAPGAVGGETPLKDGTYEGEHSFVAVSVTIINGRIADIRIVRHGGGGQKYADMIKPLVAQMLEKQSTDVDTVTGATVSSNHLKKAVNKALQKAGIK